MTSGIFTALGVAAAFSCMGDDVVSDKYSVDFHSVIPVSRNVNECSSPCPARFVGSSFSSDFNFESEATLNFSFDPYKVALKSSDTEMGSLGYRVGNDDFQYNLGAGFLDRDVIGYFEDFSVTRGGLLKECERVLREGAIKDFNVSGMTLEELAGMAEKFHEFSKVEEGDSLWIYSIDLDATARAKGMTKVESEFFVSDNLSLRMKHGFFGSVNAYGHAGVGLGVNWSEDDLTTGVNASMKYNYELKSERGMFLEIRREGANGNFFGTGVIKKQGDDDSFSGEYFANVGADILSLSAGAEFGRREIEEEIDVESHVNYLTIGTDRNNGWLSSAVGFMGEERFGIREERVKGEFFRVGLDGSEKGKLDSRTIQNVNESESGVVYSFVGGKDIEMGPFEFGAHGYFSNYPDRVSGVGGGIKSDIVNVFSSGDYSFGAVKLMGDSGSFKGDFRERAKDRASFLPGYGGASLWGGKSGVFVFAEKNGDKEKVGAAIGFDNGLRVAGGLIERDRKDGFFAEVGGRRFSVEASYLKDDMGSGDEASVGLDFEVVDDVFIGGGGSISGDDTAGFVKLKFEF